VDIGWFTQQHDTEPILVVLLIPEEDI